MTHYTNDLLCADVRHGLLVSGGPAPSAALLKKARALMPEAPFLCADAGADLCRAAGLVPDGLIGDMDSLAAETVAWLEAAQVPEVIYPAEKDFSDSDLAVQQLFDDGAKEILVLGALGGRMDHELANMMLLVGSGRRGRSIVYWDDINRLRYIGPGIHTLDRGDDYIGIVPFSEDGMTLSIEGLYYTLDAVQVPFGETRLISNIFTDAATCTITIARGDGVLIRCRDRLGPKEGN